MKNDLIERYIYAVVRHLPPGVRQDVERELDGLIADMLRERCGEVLPQEQDVKVVLTELGSPQELAAKYSGQENRALLSGAYYALYLRVLKIVLPIAAAGIALATLLGAIAQWDAAADGLPQVGSAIGVALSGSMGGLIQAFAVITIVFAILERKKVDLGGEDMFASLPPVPSQSARIAPSEAIVGMAMAIVMASVFLGFPQIVGAYLEGIGWIPLFQGTVMRGLWLPIVLWAGVGVAKEIVRLLEGQYTRRVAMATIAADIVAMACAMVIFLRRDILNPDFITQVGGWLDGLDIRIIAPSLDHVRLVFLAVLLFASLLEMGTALYRAWKGGR